MSNSKPFLAIFVLLIALLAACGPTETGTAEAAARAQLASELGVALGDVEVVSIEATEFTDSCLGLGQANESCLQAITPGWLVMLNAGGQEYEVHTDETGQQVRIAVEMPVDEDNSDTAAAAAQVFLANELGVGLGDVEVVSSVATEFTDSCLGLGQANESCLQALTPGWLVILKVAGQEYEAHTDETGQQVRIAGEMD